MPKPVRRSRDELVDAALQALLEEGPDAVAMQPLARRLAATKGSVYWHFTDRDDLLAATLDRWLQVATEDVIAALDASLDDPVTKARDLLARVTANSAKYPGQLRLYAAADHPLVHDALTRATRRRIGYVAGLLRAAGVPRAAATRRAQFAYAAYVGHAQLAAATPEVLPHSAAARRALVDEMTRALFS